MKNKIVKGLLIAFLLFLVAGSIWAVANGGVSETIWALVPPLVAISLALLTKEVYSSLFVGIVYGAFIYNNFHPVAAMNTVLNDGLIGALADSWNVGILIFLVCLGIIVALVNKAGGSAAYGDWANKNIKGRKGAMFSTFGLGVLIFIDDYFNCLTVGSVMRPITESHKISKAKMAYLIDATAAPICMIAPISSWAAAVSGMVEGYNGIELFVRAIPYNFYSLLTIVMIIAIIAMEFDYGPMKRFEINARKGDLYTTEHRPYANAEHVEIKGKGKIVDLVLPVLFLIIICVICMIYTGGFFGGESFINAFANSDASIGLSMGSILGVIFVFLLYIPRKILSPKDFMSCIPEGFVAMVPAILILTFAWSLCNVTGLMGADVYVAGLMENSAAGLQIFLPAIIFAVALGLAFATGTSWGTFGILIPIVVAVGDVLTPELMIIGVSACCAGAVCGDHCSPISDTTIMASTGAQCYHLDHVTTQLPYALTVAAVSFVVYIIAGLCQSAWISLPIGVVLMVAVLFVIKQFNKGQNDIPAEPEKIQE